MGVEGSSTRNAQYCIGLEDSRFDGGFLTIGEVGYVMKNLVDGVGTFESVSYTSFKSTFPFLSLTSRQPRELYICRIAYPTAS